VEDVASIFCDTDAGSILHGRIHHEDQFANWQTGARLNLDIQRILNLHDQFERVQTITMQIFDEPTVGSNLVGIEPQLLGDNLTHTGFNLLNIQPVTRRFSLLLGH
jgi:hypothetical protein